MSPRRPIVIGLSGGIGAGKSLVAAMLGELGCVVIDSDRLARAALDRPEVKARLREWWGDGVFGADGAVDRSAVARIVFADAAERARLEGLIHPLVKAARREMVVRASEAGAAAVVVDAPLLHEAGVDKECDVVVFVDAPREARVARVRARGWGEEELVRRESSQWNLDEKRRLADHVIVNDAGPEVLRARVGDLFRRIACNRPAG